MMTTHMDECQHLLEHNGLGSFDDIWNLDVPWYDEPNRRGEGWSGVIRLVLKGPAAEEIPVFIKRQCDYTTRTLRHPIAGELTLEKEFRNISLFHDLDLATVVPVYFSTRRVGQHRQAVLVTLELTNYVSLDKILQAADGTHSYRGIGAAVCRYLGRLHHHGICHGNFYPKHIFLRFASHSQPPVVDDVRVIDLENCERVFFRRAAAIRDLDTLNRRTLEIPSFVKLRLLVAYLNHCGIADDARPILDRLRRRFSRKNSSVPAPVSTDHVGCNQCTAVASANTNDSARVLNAVEGPRIPDDGDGLKVWHVAVIAILPASAFQGSRGIYAPDEGFYTAIAANMLKVNDFLVPQLADQPWLDKPPGALRYCLDNQVVGRAISSKYGRNDGPLGAFDMRLVYESLRHHLPTDRYEIDSVDDRLEGLSCYQDGFVESVTTKVNPYPFFIQPEHFNEELVEMQSTAFAHLFIGRKRARIDAIRSRFQTCKIDVQEVRLPWGRTLFVWHPE